MSETYYCPHDLPRFAEMGRERSDLWAKFLEYYIRRVRRRGSHRPREGADRAGRGPRRPVPVLHRRLHAGKPAERCRPRADDRGRPRRLRDPRGASLVHGCRCAPWPTSSGCSDGAIPCVHCTAGAPAGDPAAQLSRLAAHGSARTSTTCWPATGAPREAAAIEVLQVNVGSLCNQTCAHCHVDAGPTGAGMSRETSRPGPRDCLRAHPIPTLDITGGAPELNPAVPPPGERAAASGAASSTAAT